MGARHEPTAALQHDYLTTEQLAELIPGVTLRQLANWRSEGRGPRYRKLGKSILYDLHEVEEWIESQIHDGTRLPIGRRRASGAGV
jgi:predicted DNA-binding transcriptional regulator AlpA